MTLEDLTAQESNLYPEEGHNLDAINKPELPPILPLDQYGYPGGIKRADLLDFSGQQCPDTSKAQLEIKTTSFDDPFDVTIFPEFFSKERPPIQPDPANSESRRTAPYRNYPAIFGTMIHEGIADGLRNYTNSISSEVDKNTNTSGERPPLTSEQLAAIHAKADECRKTPRDINPGFLSGFERDGTPRPVVDKVNDIIHKTNGEISKEIIDNHTPPGFEPRRTVSEGSVRVGPGVVDFIKGCSDDPELINEIHKAGKKHGLGYKDVVLAAASGDINFISKMDLSSKAKKFLWNLSVYNHFNFGWISPPSEGLTNVIGGRSCRFDGWYLTSKKGAGKNTDDIIDRVPGVFAPGTSGGANPLDDEFITGPKGKALDEFFSEVGKGRAKGSIIEKKTATNNTGKSMEMGDELPDRYKIDLAHTWDSIGNLVVGIVGKRHPHIMPTLKGCQRSTSAREVARIIKKASVSDGSRQKLEEVEHIFDEGFGGIFVRFGFPIVNPITGELSISDGVEPRYRIDEVKAPDVRKWLDRLDIEMLNKFIAKRDEIRRKKQRESE